MLKARNEYLRKKGKPICKVVNREVVAILTKGILRDAKMVLSHPDPAFVMAAIEISPVFEANHRGRRLLGICAVDVASNHVMMGQFDDDDLLSNLRTHVAGQCSTSMWMLPSSMEFIDFLESV